MAREKMQMVDDDEIENVGIMSGFLDDIDELMEEIEKEGQVEEGDDADMARILDRRPDSPEILMNNLRGDYRSIDARREELADRVGYNAAQQTPDEVLAMLQPIFAQQGIAALPMGGADVGALPMDAMTGMPPPGGMPPPAGMPMDPAMMGMPPEMMSMPPEGIASLPMDKGAMPPMQMARGGIVQHFERGGAAARIDEIMASQGQTPVDAMARARELTPEYQELLGLSDNRSNQSQMLFDIAQAALGYASNVGPDGQPLRGSGAARLAGATRALPGQLGARAAAMQDDQTRARLAALQQAQSEREATIASNTALSAEQRAILLEQMKQENELANRARYRMATPAELAALGNPTGLVQYDQTTGKYEVSRDPVTNINTGEAGLGKVVTADAITRLSSSADQAAASIRTLNTVANIRPLLNEELFSGPGSTSLMLFTRIGQNLGVAGDTSEQKLANTVETMRGLAEFELQAAQGMKGQGALSDAERALIRRASAGDLATMGVQEIAALVNALETSANDRISSHNQLLNLYQEVYKDDPSVFSLGTYALPSMPVTPPAASGSGTTTSVPPLYDPAAAQAELQRRAAGGN
jgi:hypothetical protein